MTKLGLPLYIGLLPHAGKHGSLLGLQKNCEVTFLLEWPCVVVW